MRKIGINLHAYKNLTDEENISYTASSGFDTVFCKFYDKERQASLAKLLEKHALECESIHAPYRDINSIWLDNATGDDMLDKLKTCVDHCQIVGAKIAVVHLSGGNNPPPITDIGRDRFARLVDHASSKSIKIAFENQRKLANIAWALEAFTPDTAGFCWDCGHEFCCTPGRHYMPIFGDRLICTHIHDNSCIYNDDAHLIPFDCKIDFGYVTDRLKEYSYNGTLMLEIGNEAHYKNISPTDFYEKAVCAAKKLRAMVDGE